LTILRDVEFATCDVTLDVQSVSIHWTDDHGRPATLVLPSDCLHALHDAARDRPRRAAGPVPRSTPAITDRANR